MDVLVLGALRASARLFLCVGMIAVSLSLILLAPIVIAAQPSDRQQMQSDADALAEAEELDAEVVALYNAGQFREFFRD